MTRERYSVFVRFIVGPIVLAGSVLAQSPASTSDEALARQAFDDSQKAWRSAKFDDALMMLTKIEKDYGSTAVAAEALLEAGRALAALGYPATAMQELQKVRNRPWPRLLEADMAALREVALARITLLQRIYLRPGAPFTGAAKPFGAAVPNVFALRVSGKNAVYWAGERGVGPTTWAPLPPAKDLRGLTLDATGKPIVIDGGQLVGGPADVLKISRPNDKPEPLEKIAAAVQLASSGDWIVQDDDKGLMRFKSDGTHVGPFQAGTQRRVKALKLAINDFDEIAAIDTEASRIVFFNATGAEIGDIADVRAELKEPQDLTFDAFGHLYVLDQRTLAILSPYAPAPGEAAARPAPAGASAKPAAVVTNRGDAYQVRVRFSEPEKSREGFHRGAALAVERSGAVYVYDKELKQVLVYR